MKYLNANEVFPKELLLEIQKYVSGKAVYVPNLENERIKWGQNTGARDAILKRNYEIKEKMRKGFSIEELSNEYNLSFESIKKIVYKKNDN
jgi:Mor family transcriptional regulator